MVTIEEVRAEAAGCRRCSLWEAATQTVFGEGPADARLMLVGEQPGDQEDLQGRPFVGPAGAVLACALADAGIDRRRTYVTNAVKHFKFIIQRGKRRLHQKPNSIEIDVCRHWLEQELDLLQPEMVVALGATAARAVFGREMAIQKNRGRILPLGQVGGRLSPSIPPSSCGCRTRRRRRRPTRSSSRT